MGITRPLHSLGIIFQFWNGQKMGKTEWRSSDFHILHKIQADIYSQDLQPITSKADG